MMEDDILGSKDDQIVKEDDPEYLEKPNFERGLPLTENKETDHPPPPHRAQDDSVILDGAEVPGNAPKSVPPCKDGTGSRKFHLV